MKAYHITIPICLGIIFAAWWFISTPVTTASGQKPSNLIKVTEDKTGERRTLEQNQLGKNRITELKEQLIEQAKKLGETRSPQTDELIVDARMKYRLLRCRQLLESWGVSEGDITEIFSIIRERERELLDKRYTMFAKGVSGVKDYKLDETAAKGVSGFRIEQILGSERAAELAALERTIESERRGPSRKYNRD